MSDVDLTSIKETVLTEVDGKVETLKALVTDVNSDVATLKGEVVEHAEALMTNVDLSLVDNKVAELKSLISGNDDLIGALLLKTEEVTGLMGGVIGVVGSGGGLSGDPSSLLDARVSVLEDTCGETSTGLADLDVKVGNILGMDQRLTAIIEANVLSTAESGLLDLKADVTGIKVDFGALNLGSGAVEGVTGRFVDELTGNTEGVKQLQLHLTKVAGGPRTCRLKRPFSRSE